MFAVAPLVAAADSESDPDAVFASQIRPLLKSHCLDCHATETQEAGVDIGQFVSLAAVRADIEPWQAMLRMLESEEMPPEGEPQFRPDDRELVINWIRALLDREAKLRAGDPGPVLVRRLNNAEYGYTIRDLTGVDLQPASQFPADGAAGEGFLNATDALAMSPGWMNKYLHAAKEIAAHAVLLPNGFRFSTSKFKEDWVNKVLTEILALYTRYSTDLGEIPLDRYLTATIVHRDAIRSGKTSCAEVAEAEKLSPKYVELLWQSLTCDESSLLLDPLRERWAKATPADNSQLLDHIAMWQSLVWRRLSAEGAHALDDRFVANPVYLAEHQTYRLQMPDEKSSESAEEQPDAPVAFYLGMQVVSGAKDQSRVILHHPRFESRHASDNETAEEPPLALHRALEMVSPTTDNSPPPPDGVHRIDQARFVSDPQDESVGETNLVLQGSEVVEVRLPSSLIAGRTFVVEARPDPGNTAESLVRFDVRHSPTPSQIERSLAWTSRAGPPDLTLLIARADASARDEMDRSADEFRRLFPISLCYPGIIVRDATVTLERFHRGDGFLSKLMLNQRERPQLDRLWEELHYISRDALQVRDSLATLVQGEIEAYEHLREEVVRRADETEQNLVESEPSHLAQLLNFAATTYRRPLMEREQQSLLDLYRSLRRDDLPHDEAFRSVLARVLVSPNFLYRIEKSPQVKQPAPVSDWELATRLSYLLWSSMPDEELRRIAAEGRLHEPPVLAEQTRRMLQDPRSRALAIEFGTQWLEVRKFDQFQGKNLELFPTFDAQLRQAIYEETILFLHDMFQADHSLWQLIDADHTFLNERLATHYDIPGIQGPEFRRVDGVKQHGRGGTLGLASVLAKHSSASRTSPVLRGNWIAETLLGERLPRPPAEVPKLPEGETDGGLTIRQLVEKHAELKQCAVCHQRIDPLGFALEQYDTIGRWREKDLGGRPVDAQARLMNGTDFDGIDGLRQYLLTQRKDDFLRQFCRKLLGFALGRRVLLSDRQLLEEMATCLKKNGGRVSGAVLTVVSSKQFQYIRGSEAEN